MKFCVPCNTEKSKSEFSKCTSRSDGVQYRCKECVFKFRKANKEKIAFQKQQYHAKQKEHLLEKRKVWESNNPDYFTKYRQNNKGSINARNRTRQAAKLQRTPKWLTDIDFERIETQYKLAQILTKLHNEPWHVDHIIPLQGRLVSGLHVPCNLQVLKGSENCSKQNNFVLG